MRKYLVMGRAISQCETVPYNSRKQMFANSRLLDSIRCFYGLPCLRNGGGRPPPLTGDTFVPSRKGTNLVSSRHGFSASWKFCED